MRLGSMQVRGIAHALRQIDCYGLTESRRSPNGRRCDHTGADSRNPAWHRDNPRLTGARATFRHRAYTRRSDKPAVRVAEFCIPGQTPGPHVAGAQFRGEAMFSEFGTSRSLGVNYRSAFGADCPSRTGNLHPRL